MKVRALFWLCLSFLAGLGFLFAAPQTVSAADDPILPICLPDAYLYDPQDCLPLGPSQTLTELAQDGIRLPEPPLPMHRTPYAYSYVDYQYIKVTTEGAINVYDSLAGAVADSPLRSMPGGFRYFSYSQRQEPPEGIYYQVKTTEWVWGGDVSRVSAPNYQGLVFDRTPLLDFAFIIETQTDGYSAPGYNQPLSGNVFRRFDLAYVYEETTLADGIWYRVGVNDWLPKRVIAVAHVNPVPPEGVDNGRWVEIDLFQQVLMVYENQQLVFATLVSTGVAPFYTQPGLFQIYERKQTEDMTTSDPSDFYYLEDVPWTQYFDQARALHGIYWHPWLGYNNSHGCVNLSIADARWLWEWADNGDWVYVWDPSGETPTDPSLYSAGGP
ncbi:MAG: L,D-transpeptidase [Anaerolineae bacterium]|nr:L,D-transpeptidase [Anaerolineae bacterium]